MIGLSYCTCIFLMTRPFTWYHNFWPCDLDLEVWPTCENFNLGCYFNDGCRPASVVVFWQLLFSACDSKHTYFFALVLYPVCNPLSFYKWNPIILSAPEPKSQVHYCYHVLSVRPSSVRPSLTFHILDFSSETTEQNSRKLDRKQELNTLYQVCVFRVDRKNKMAALASDWLRHFRLLLWYRWTEFNETW